MIPGILLSFFCLMADPSRPKLLSRAATYCRDNRFLCIRIMRNNRTGELRAVGNDILDVLGMASNNGFKYAKYFPTLLMIRISSQQIACCLSLADLQMFAKCASVGKSSDRNEVQQAAFRSLPSEMQDSLNTNRLKVQTITPATEKAIQFIQLVNSRLDTWQQSGASIETYVNTINAEITSFDYENLRDAAGNIIEPTTFQLDTIAAAKLNKSMRVTKPRKSRAKTAKGIAKAAERAQQLQKNPHFKQPAKKIGKVTNEFKAIIKEREEVKDTGDDCDSDEEEDDVDDQPQMEDSESADEGEEEDNEEEEGRVFQGKRWTATDGAKLINSLPVPDLPIV